MLPNFLILGAQKAATSWLAVCLGEHPQIFIPDKKEIFFFDKYYSRGLPWYETQFSEYQGESAVGEATPNYLFAQIVPKRILNTLGNIKLIASLRHPVDRAYSAFWHYIRRNLIAKNADFKSEFERDGEYSLRSRGYYFVQISRYLDYFPRNNLLIVFQEEIVQQPYQILKQCYDLLDVEKAFKPLKIGDRVNPGDRVLIFHDRIYGFRKLLNKLPANIRNQLIKRAAKVQKHLPEAQKPPRLDPDLRQELFEKYYADDAERLSQLLCMDLSYLEKNNQDF